MRRGDLDGLECGADGGVLGEKSTDAIGGVRPSTVPDGNISCGKGSCDNIESVVIESR